MTVDGKLSVLKRDCKKFGEFLLIDCKILFAEGEMKI